MNLLYGYFSLYVHIYTLAKKHSNFIGQRAANFAIKYSVKQNICYRLGGVVIGAGDQSHFIFRSVQSIVLFIFKMFLRLVIVVAFIKFLICAANQPPNIVFILIDDLVSQSLLTLLIN